jgi:23S rRNA (cytosine1962-C5)-methyltransferase
MKGNPMSLDSHPLKNRLSKNLKRLKTYLNKGGIEAYRLYHKDIPEFPYLIDIYGDHAVIYEQGKKMTEEEDVIREKHQKEISDVLRDGFGITVGHQHFKIRERQKGANQYHLVKEDSHHYFTINEPPFKFLVNPERYLDTGLFLDMRPLRQQLLKTCADKMVMNLFCYTGSLSVAAAKGGAALVVSVDMSKTYLEWAEENFRVNDLDPESHIFKQADVLKELERRKEQTDKFDIIILDPPSFSNSKRMEEDLDVQRDHPILVRDCMLLLQLDGVLYFSTNKKKFDLHPIIDEKFAVKEISQWTIPMDFHHTQIHRAFEIRHRH